MEKCLQKKTHHDRSIFVSSIEDYQSKSKSSRQVRVARLSNKNAMRNGRLAQITFTLVLAKNSVFPCLFAMFASRQRQ